MSEFKKACITGAVMAAVLFTAWDCHAATASANHGHHGGGNNGAMGASAGAFGGSAGASAGSGQSGQGGSYGDYYLHSSVVDGYQPWPQAEMRQFQKP